MNLEQKLLSGYYQNRKDWEPIRYHGGIKWVPCDIGKVQPGHKVQEFRKDLACEFGLDGNHKESMVWKRAWEEGNAIGFIEICCIYCDLAGKFTVKS